MQTNIGMKQCPLHPARIPALLLLRSDPAASRAAACAANELEALFKAVTAGDLLRRAASMPRDGVEWLRELGSAAREMREALKVERNAADRLVAHDSAERHRFDSGACKLAVTAQEIVNANQAAALAPDTSFEQVQRDMAAAGLSVEEVAAVLERRRAEGTALTQARDKAKAAIAEAERRGAVFSAFLRDPLRRLSQVPEALADEIVAATGVNEQRLADARRPSRSASHAGAQLAQPE